MMTIPPMPRFRLRKLHGDYISRTGISNSPTQLRTGREDGGRQAGQAGCWVDRTAGRPATVQYSGVVSFLKRSALGFSREHKIVGRGTITGTERLGIRVPALATMEPAENAS